MRMKKHTQDLIAEAPRGCSQVGITIGIDLGDVWSHYCTLNEDGEVVDRGRFRTNPSSVDKWFTDLPGVRIAMEAGTHSIWISAFGVVGLACIATQKLRRRKVRKVHDSRSTGWNSKNTVTF